MRCDEKVNRPDVEAARGAQPEARQVHHERPEQRPVDPRVIPALQTDAVRAQREQRRQIACRIGAHERHDRTRLGIEVQGIEERVLLQRVLIDQPGWRSMELEQTGASATADRHQLARHEPVARGHRRHGDDYPRDDGQQRDEPATSSALPGQEKDQQREWDKQQELRAADRRQAKQPASQERLPHGRRLLASRQADHHNQAGHDQRHVQVLVEQLACHFDVFRFELQQDRDERQRREGVRARAKRTPGKYRCADQHPAERRELQR